jgi:hypothetical protein
MAKHENAGRWRLEDTLYLVALSILVALFFYEAWLQPEGMWYAPGASYSDLTISHWPNWLLVRESLHAHGQVPLWRPSILGGTPHVGNPLSALFYPPNWLALLLPLASSFNVQYALHALGAGVALYCLARWGYGRSPFAAFVGGLGYALSPKWVAHVGAGHVGLCQAYAWLPLVVWALRALFRSRDLPLTLVGLADGADQGAIWKSRLQLFGCAAALAMAYLADPRVAFYGAGMAALYALYRLALAGLCSGWRLASSWVLPLLIAPVAFFLLAAVQILPTANLMPLTTRSAITLREASQDALPVRYLLGYLIADRGGAHEWMTYLGLLPLGLSVLALWRGRDRARWFWAGLALLALLYALGTNGPLFPLLYRLLPALGWVRVPSRALLLVALSANLLAALGVDALLDDKWPDPARRWARRLALAGGLTCAGLGVGIAILYGIEAPPALYALAGIGSAACATWLLGLWPRVPRVLVQAPLLVLLIVDLWLVGHSLIELRPPAQVFTDQDMDVAAYLVARTPPGGLSRVYSPSYSVPQHVAERLGLELLDGVDPVQLSWAASYVRLAGGYSQQGYSITQPPYPRGTDVRSAWEGARPDARLLGALNVCAVAAEFPIESPGLKLETQIEDTYIYDNQRCLPRAYLTGRVQLVDGWQQAHEVLQAEIDPTQGALVEGGRALAGPPGWTAATVGAHTPNRIVVEAKASQRSLLVLAEVWSPGWRVTVDGVEQQSHRVNGVARGVYLEPGTHTVVWRYRPASLRWGAALTLSGWDVLVVSIVWVWLKGRAGGRTSGSIGVRRHEG